MLDSMHNWSVLEESVYDVTGKPVPNYKLLQRCNQDGVTAPLGIVSENYTVIRNSVFFGECEAKLRDFFGSASLDARVVDIKEYECYGGRDCFREYRFNSITQRIGDHEIRFRLMLRNSYVSRSTALISGMLNMFCWNGMVIGDHVSRVIGRHTKGLTMHKFTSELEKSIKSYQTETEQLDLLRGVHVNYHRATEFFDRAVDDNVMSRKRADHLLQRFHYNESRDIASDAWGLYNTLTWFATHRKLRETANDHDGMTRLTDQSWARKVLDSDAWREEILEAA